MVIAKTIVCKGKVQGVYYRASTKAKAISIGLTGYVKNKPNGDVVIHVQGNKATIDQLIEWCHVGSERAVVNNVICTPADIGDYTDFEIIY